MKKIREFIRMIVLGIHHWYLTKVWGMHIDKSARISLGAKLDKTFAKGIYIGEESFVASNATILTHDFCRGVHAETTIGKRCFIGVNSLIMPGITIGDNAIIGGGTVVTKNVPCNCIVAGNPGKIIREGIQTGKFGRLIKDGTKY